MPVVMLHHRQSEHISMFHHVSGWGRGYEELHPNWYTFNTRHEYDMVIDVKKRL